MNIQVLRVRLAALAGGALLFFGALGSVVHAQTDVYGLTPGVYPYWDGGNPTAWSLGAVPTATQDALFPMTPGANTVAASFRPDGTEVGITNLNPGNPTPIANNLIFLGNYQLVAASAPPILATPSFLTLNSGGVTVVGQNLVILDTNVVVLSGQLTKMGTGTLLIDANWTITGNVLVQQGTFGGAGFVSGNLVNQAIVAPANSALHIGGGFTQQKSGTLSIGVNSPTSYGQLAIGGKARLNGELSISLGNEFLPKRGEKFNIITADGVSGEFDNVKAPVWDLLTLRPIYGDSTVTLKAVVNSFEALPGLSSNERAVAQNLDRIIYDPRAADLLNNLYGRGLNDLPKQLDKISPAELTSIFTMGVALETMQSINLQRRTDDIRSGSSGFSAAGLAINGAGPSYSGGFDITTGVAGPDGVASSGSEGKEVKETKGVVPADNRWGAFLSGTGEWVSVGSTENARGYTLDSGGFTLGVDYKVTPNFAIGLAAGYTGTTADLTDHGRVWVNGGKLGLYSTVFTGGWYADAAAFGGYNSYDTRRAGLGGEARGDTDGGEINALFGTGYDFKAGGLTFGPTATFNYTYVGMNGFTEHDSLAPLDVHGSNAESLRTAFGVKTSYDLKLGGLLVRPELRAAWQHEFGDAVYDLNSSFANGAGDSFLAEGPRIGRDSALLGAGFTVQFSERCATYFYYDGELARKNYQSTNVTGGLRVAF